ncbi:OmpA family protein [Pelagivirga sediminicola]|uniref:OmpA family protein n=1 Tax=Pelagivirga sediminicola TaxID=2170575 RepID=A0A2T7GC30_9RHOB|nr:OmpA family protein [Pelagivirga sediminicola]PVA11985.1 OmpA family protein [Pelagivirga sediminicola]
MSGAHALRRALALVAALLAGPVTAADLALPGNAVMSRETVEEAASHALPVGPWSGGSLDARDVEGRITRQAWRIDSASQSTLQIMDMLETQLESAGFAPLFRCASEACGGFDFRFALKVLPPPEMFVDLFDYRFLSAHRPAEGAQSGDDYISLLVSRSGRDAYVQITRITPASRAAAPPLATGANAAPGGVAGAPAPSGAPIVQSLTQRGHAVLRDLDFATAADTLGPGPYASLTALAAFLKADKTRRIALVGHTDTVGGLDANLALSRRRAEAVMQRLMGAHGVPAAQLEADGIAYLSPIAPNTTEPGRETNRRVEAVLLSGG